ncbi:hypothetical protein [Brevibacillus daliensis]|uniref:hypothetical protein n=1 Tax=Brevibacillus daliensis TaxID=2892995 RepID=UPI001E44AFA4|nr:hypothetical protein [Brevibacillus daliensis]
MQLIKIGQGYELPVGDYCGIRIQENGIPKFEVRLSGTAAAVINANKNIYEEVYEWLEQIAENIYSTGEVTKFEVIKIDSTHINDKQYIIKNWKNLIKG